MAAPVKIDTPTEMRQCLERVRDALIPLLYAYGDVPHTPLRKRAWNRVKLVLDEVECLLDPSLGKKEE